MVDDTEPGKGIVWRVKSISEAYATRTPTVQLEHVINTLRDKVLFGEHKPKDITGNSNATTCTAEQAVRFILSKQSDWVLGRFDYASVSNPYQFDGDTLFDALETVTNSLKDAWWVYDTDSYPFHLSIIRKIDTEYSELRPGRNLKTISKTIDKSQMYTRFYPIGKDDLHLSDYAVDKNTEYYGVVSKVDTDASIDSEEELRRWANEQLELHAEPTVTIEAEGLDLADATGESIDRMWLGYCCRIPLTEFGTTISERIVGLTYPDKIKQPEVVKVTLSNTRTDLTKILSETTKSGGKSKRTSTKQSKEDHAWFEDTNEHVAMCAIGIIGKDAQGNPNWIRLSELVVDGEGIHASVKSLQGEMVVAQTAIEMNEYEIRMEAQRRGEGDAELNGKLVVQADRITAEVTRASTAEGRLSGRLDVTAEAINAEVTRATTAEGTLSGRITVEADRITQEVTRATTAEGTLSGRITVEAGKITQIVSAVGSNGEVTAASICLAINNGGSTATINADKIYLLGQTIADTITASYIDAKISTLATLHAKDISANSITAGVNLYLPNGLSVYSQGLWTVTLTQDGNTYTLKQTTLNGTESTIGTFSRATSLSGAWSGRNYTVTASPQGNTKTGIVYDGLVTTGNVTRSNKFVYQDVIVYSDDGEGNADSVIMTKSVGINASSVWDAGQDAKHVDAIRITGNGNRYWDGNTYYQNVGVAADYNTGGSYVTAITVDVTGAYYSGFDATRNLRMVDVNDNAVSSVTVPIGTTKEYWPEWQDSNGSWQYVAGRKISVTGGYNHQYALKCTGATQSGGVVTYTFETSGGSFSSGTTYTFYT